jgi:hypothetical protein
MSQFSFRTDVESEQYCREIMDVLMSAYGLSQSEALHLLNKGWKGLDFLGEDLIYHELPEFWAEHFMTYWRDR